MSTPNRFLFFLFTVSIGALSGPGSAFSRPPLPPVITGNLYVSSYGTHEVYCYAPDGRFLFKFSHEDLRGTRGLAFAAAVPAQGDSPGADEWELYVSSQSTDRVLVFDPDGNYLRQFTGGGLDGPTSLAFGPDGKLYVSSFGTNEILVFAGDKYESKFTAEGLRGPNCVAFASSGGMYVASQLTNRVYRFAADGTFLEHFEDAGLRSPMGVAIYAGRVYVTGGSSHTVSIFSLEGALVHHIDTEEKIPGPQGIAFDDRGHFVITSFYNGEIARYAREADTPSVLYESHGVKVARSVAYLPLTGGPQQPFVRGDFNRDASFDISDPVAILGYLFAGTPDARCLDAGDANDDGKLNIADAIHSLGHLFAGGAAPPAPFPESGRDPTADELACF